ncbi:hypothetical protein IWW36_000289 [Coemansia brasiliensis]|uniref:Uncharacterized protein n=1 Tax=Coemansia brasiliensis TaxID=2650707 RepID=A0A9W8IHM0_9FUNG|nr:hypothetical protein IWW36_000289 [Coemansia brasiliensis]
MSRHPVSWWQRWAFLEELVFAIQQNIGFIRLGVSMVVAAAWTSVVMQLAIVCLTGKCRLVVKGSQLVENPENILQLCGLLRKGLVATMAVWTCWMLLTMLLIFINTQSESSRPQMLNYDHMGIPMNILDYGPQPVMRHPTAISSGNNIKQPTPSATNAAPVPTSAAAAVNNQQPSCSSTYPHYCYNPGSHMASQPKQQQYQRHGSSAIGPTKRMPIKHMRSSWSQLDEDSIVSESMRSDSQSILQSQQSKAQLFLQSQNMLQQFYQMQSQQFQGIHSFMPPAFSEEHKRQKLPPITPSTMPYRGRMQSVLHKSGYSSASAIPEPISSDVAAGLGDYNHKSSHSISEVNEQLPQSNYLPQKSREEHIVRRQTAASANIRPMPSDHVRTTQGGTPSNENQLRSLAALKYDIGKSKKPLGSSTNTKRNTIG